MAEKCNCLGVVLSLPFLSPSHFPSFHFGSIKPLNATQAYGPNLRYIVRWRRRDPRGSWHNETVKTPRHVVWNTPIYVPYEIKVQAENDFGRAPEPDTYIGYSGEDCEYCFRAGAHPRHTCAFRTCS